MKHTKEVLEPLVKESFSVSEVTRKLGLKNANGGTSAYISKAIKRAGLDTSHFLGKGRNRGSYHHGGPVKLSWGEILKNDRKSGIKENTSRLRRAMIESGFEFICSKCNCGTMWNGERLTLQISHKNGNPLDNRKENLQFECPNCHSQTDDYAGKGISKNKALLAERHTHFTQNEATIES